MDHDNNITQKKRALFNWSGGKDSALALYKVMEEEEYDVVSLLTTVNSSTHRSSMHAIPVSILQAQADSIGIPLYIAELSPDGEMQGYNQAMITAVDHFKAIGVDHFIFGDIFLHDVRSYREKQLNPYKIEVVEPLWDRSSEEVMEMFLESGLKTIVVTTMADLLGEEYIGRIIDRSFIESLPQGIDVCGENGEYHTFCFDGKIFRYPIPFEIGAPFRQTHEVNMKDGTTQSFNYWYTELK